MAKAIDVAKYIIDIFSIKAEHNLDDGMTNLRLQKLLYLSQGYYFARYGKPLFKEDMIAWQYGPVVLPVYERYSSFENNVIKDSAPEPNALSPEESELVLDVLSKYGKYSTGRLVNMSHEPDSPWSQVFEETKNNKIPKELIKNYFEKQEKLLSTEEKIKAKFGKPSEEKRGPNGYILLPSEDYEDWSKLAIT